MTETQRAMLQKYEVLFEAGLKRLGKFGSLPERFLRYQDSIINKKSFFVKILIKLVRYFDLRGNVNYSKALFKQNALILDLKDLALGLELIKRTSDKDFPQLEDQLNRILLKRKNRWLRNIAKKL